MPFSRERDRDRAIRTITAVVLAAAARATWPATVAVLSLMVGAILLVTELAGWCAACGLSGFCSRKTIAA